MTVEMLAGDCLEVLPTLAENSVDSCVCDPPYHLTSIVKRFGGEAAAPVIGHKTGAYGGGFKPEGNGTGAAFARMSRGFMGKRWDGGDIAFRPDVWREVWRVLKPGAHLLAFGGTRTYHRMACAIEDAGFEIRDTIMWVYGSGFPKSHNIGNGYGTALKPAVEPIVLARKPLSEGTVAANVLRWATGAINVDGCRVEADDKGEWPITQRRHDDVAYTLQPVLTDSTKGRWPANLIHDGSEEVLAGFPESVSVAGAGRNGKDVGDVFSLKRANDEIRGHNDSGSAARFFATFPLDNIYEEVAVTWISESEPHQAVLRVGMEQSLARATVVSASGDVSGWSMFLSGSTITDLFQKATNCTIRTATGSIIQSRIWNWLTTLLTSASIPAANSEVENGGNRVENADNGVQSIIITLGETVSLPGANNAASGTRLKISVSVGQLEKGNEGRLKYTSKAGADDRLGAFHPTVKPLDLMQYLVRLVTPKGGLVLDPFAGTGTTGEAAFREGMNAVLIEREAEYQADIKRRIAMLLGGPEERAREAIKERMKDKPRDDGPLFGGAAVDDRASGRAIYGVFADENGKPRA